MIKENQFVIISEKPCRSTQYVNKTDDMVIVTLALKVNTWRRIKEQLRGEANHHQHC